MCSKISLVCFMSINSVYCLFWIVGGEIFCFLSRQRLLDFYILIAFLFFLKFFSLIFSNIVGVQLTKTV